MADIEVLAGTGSDLEAIDRLARKIEVAIRAVAELRAERDELRRQLHESNLRNDELASELEGSSNSRNRIDHLTREREDLLRDRSVLASRVETILEKIEVAGL